MIRKEKREWKVGIYFKLADKFLQILYHSLAGVTISCKSLNLYPLLLKRLNVIPVSGFSQNGLSGFVHQQEF